MGTSTMYASTSALTSFTGMFNDTGTLLVASIAVILGGAVALLGLGFAWRHLKKYITGRKF